MSTQPEQSPSRFPENLPVNWRRLLSEEKDKAYFTKLVQFLGSEYRSKKTIYPKQENILKAIQLLDFDRVKVVILGQDPYHGPNQAIGLSFAVPNSLPTKPPSLVNIFKEIESDLEVHLDRKETELDGWVNQGVLLLNTVLTVRASQAYSHREKGWEQFTDQVIRVLNSRSRPVLFLLWGAAAQKKKSLLDLKRHPILEAPHPSPLSAHRGFFGCKHFSKANEILVRMGETPIDWTATSCAKMDLKNEALQ